MSQRISGWSTASDMTFLWLPRQEYDEQGVGLGTKVIAGPGAPGGEPLAALQLLDAGVGRQPPADRGDLAVVDVQVRRTTADRGTAVHLAADEVVEHERDGSAVRGTV